MKASWASAVAERVNALCGMAPSGMLARDGVGGMGVQPLPANLRDGARRRTPKPWDIETEVDEDTGLPRPVMRRCLVTNTNPPTDLGDWRDFPEIEEGETCSVFLKVTLPQKEEVDDEPSVEYAVVALVDGEEPEEDADGGLSTLYPLYRLGAGGKVLVDYRDAFVRTFNFYTDERSVSRADYPDWQQVLSLSHFYDNVRDLTLAAARAKAKCDIVVRAVFGDGERVKVGYVPLSSLLSGGGSSGGSDNPGGSGDSGGTANVTTEWLKKNGVISVNGLQGKIAVIGGKSINVSTSGNSIVISLDSEKDYEDENPYPPTTDECPHPGGGYGYGDESDPDSDLPGGGGVYGENGTESQSGVTDDCCGGASAVASGTGYPTEGASGYPVDGDGYPTTGGKPATGGSSQGGVPASSGLFNGSTIPRTTIEDVQGGAHSMLGPSGGTTIEDVQGGTHSMNQSPFVSGGNATTIESSQDNIHTMNQSPFKKGSQ